MAKNTKKRKKTTAVIAAVMAVVLLLGGTFAWQSINQTALNEASDVINPGGRLHDDFNGTNKDVYVENFAEDEIFARIRLDEYFEIVMNKGVEGAERVSYIAGEKDNDGNIISWATHKFDQYNATDEYWNWTTGGSTIYMPTFNKNKDSLEADVNGTYQGVDGVVTDEATDDRYTNYVTYEDGESKYADAIYDADANNIDDDGITTVQEEHFAESTLEATLISMEEWMNNGSQPGPYWVYDEDGWVYWAQAIQPGEATGLLLDGIELAQVMDDSWYYAINVVAQFVTADDLGMSDGTGFYDAENGTEPSDNALKLLETIGVQVSEQETEEDVAYDISFDELAIIGSNDTTGISLGLYTDGSEVTEGVTYSVSSANAVVEDGVIKASETVSMDAALEQYTVTAYVDDSEVATTTIYMYDTTRHTLDDYCIVTTESGYTYCMFYPAATAYPVQPDPSTYCVWRFGDGVDTIYTCTFIGNAYIENIAKEIETILYNGEQGEWMDLEYVSCEH